MLLPISAKSYRSHTAHHNDRKRQLARNFLAAPSFLYGMTMTHCSQELSWGMPLTHLLQQAAEAVSQPITVLPH